MLKLLTLNTHSLEESEMDKKQKIFADTVSELLPDVIALQEVNQSQNSDLLMSVEKNGVNPTSIPFRKDNHAAAVAKKLAENGTPYYWIWMPIKTGYGCYDEGLAFFSRKPILDTEVILVSDIDDYQNADTRKILGICTEDGWFYSIHLSWWTDQKEPFERQFRRLNEHLKDRKNVYLMGDFNGDSSVRNESYDLVLNCGWTDSYSLAENRDEGWTVVGAIDGWRDQISEHKKRIDQIWIRDGQQVISNQVIFNGRNRHVISDHFGVLAEIQSAAV